MRPRFGAKTIAASAPIRAGALLLWAAASVAAQAAPPPVFHWPVDCTLGVDCFIQNYVDRDPGPTAQDFTCGALTYEDHKGTDIRVALENQLGPDAPLILAAAPGQVRGVRGDMGEGVLGRPGSPSRAEIQGRECGNGLVIDHGGGWESQYCHLAQGSLQVRRGDRVETGQVLGRMGLSGATEFPHLHFSLRQDGATRDPFAPNALGCSPDPSSESLWASPIPYQPGGFLAQGIARAIPEFDAVKQGLAPGNSLPATAPALVAWGFAFGIRPGDAMRFVMTGPQGTLFDRTVLMEKPHAQALRSVGLRRPAEGSWPPGPYDTLIELRRDGSIYQSRRQSFEVTP